jgi:hypothetical protein
MSNNTGIPDQQPPQVPAYWPTPAPQRSKALPIVASVAGAVLLAVVGIGGYIAFGPKTYAGTQSAAVVAPTPTTVTQQPQQTVVVRPAPAPSTVYAPANPAGTSSYDSNGDAVPFLCSSDGVHLYATVSISNTSSEPHDFIGTLEFIDSSGNYLGQGGFSAASLASGSSIDAYVDTGDPNDPRASQQDLSNTAGDLGCVLSDLHSK